MCWCLRPTKEASKLCHDMDFWILFGPSAILRLSSLLNFSRLTITCAGGFGAMIFWKRMVCMPVNLCDLQIWTNPCVHRFNAESPWMEQLEGVPNHTKMNGWNYQKNVNKMTLCNTWVGDLWLQVASANTFEPQPDRLNCRQTQPTKISVTKKDKQQTMNCFSRNRSTLFN